jgi:uncharacterized protein YndB with AHSA1/START domain
MSELEPVVRALSPGVPGERAFKVFTQHIGQWWPPAFTVSGHNLAQVVLNPQRLYEVDLAGNDYQWATVLVWEPPRRIVLEWTLGLSAGETSEVELVFTDEVVTLAHRGLGPDRPKFDGVGGWDVVLTAYAAAI